MKLYYTPRSHFSRKVRILLDAMNLPVELIDVGNVADSSSDVFGPNPLLKVPNLVDGDYAIFESDHIAQHVVRKYDKDDPFFVVTQNVDDLNARAVMNGVMASEVELILAKRTGIDTNIYLRYDKMKTSIHNGLAWLDSQENLFSSHPSYLVFHFLAMWDHVSLYNITPLNYSNLRKYADHWSSLSYVKASIPA